MTANPGIPMPEAILRMNAHNAALANGEQPPPLTDPNPLGYTNPYLHTNNNNNNGSVTNAITAVGAAVLTANQGEGGAVTKPHRELYIGNIPPGITTTQISDFLTTALRQLGFAKDHNAVLSAWISPDGHYAFCEVRTVEEANAALTYLNGIQVGAFCLKIGRPKGYNPNASGPSAPVAMPSTMPMPFNTNPLLAGLNNNVLSLTGTSSMSNDPLSNVIMVTNLPGLITEDQIKELFKPFGELKEFNLIKSSTNNTQSAVLEYVNPAITDGVVNGMNKLDLADHKLSVQRVPVSSVSLLLKPASITLTPKLSSSSSFSSLPVNKKTNLLESYPPSRVLRMSNMTTEEDLTDDKLYQELIEDVAEECNAHGLVKSIIVPRGTAGVDRDESVGQIFVSFVDVSAAQKTLKAVSGRKFNGNFVEAHFYPEDLFAKKIYVITEENLKNSKGSAGLDEYKPDVNMEELD